MEISAAEFAVGDGLQAGVFLELDDLGDRLVFHLAQLGRIDFAARFALARLQQVFRPQEAADVIGAEWGLGSLRHGLSLAGERVEF